jgi:hypothetical protein
MAWSNRLRGISAARCRAAFRRDTGKSHDRPGILPRVAYAQVADDIQQRITEGEIELKLPSERSFAEEYEVSYTTVRHAMAILPDRGHHHGARQGNLRDTARAWNHANPRRSGH